MKLLLIQLLLLGSILFLSCNEPALKNKKIKKIPTPTFNQDSAYHYIKQQVDFGPRVPKTEAHKKCAEYLISKLNEYKALVTVQNGTVMLYDSTKLVITNIIGHYNLSSQNRIMLYAHWDTRPFADMDTVNKDKPIAGANDGASGVGVLLEIARQMCISMPEVGVDIFFFDAEDYGEPADFPTQKIENWCLGSQYWAKNKHMNDYTASFGILLDMVGGIDAKFTKEDNSRHYASVFTKYVWGTAAELGYERFFLNIKTQPIIDDHYFINTIANIPSLVIIEFNPKTENNYSKYWHTHQDNMSIISKITLKAVGQTVLEIIYSE